MVEISEIFPRLLKPAYYKILQLYVSKFIFFQHLVLLLEMAVLERFWCEHSKKTVVVIYKDKNADVHP